MDKNTLEMLEFNKVKENIANFAISEEAKKLIYDLRPFNEYNKILKKINEVTEARKIIDIRDSVPISSIEGISSLILKLGKGITLMPGELTSVSKFLDSVKRLKVYMKSMEQESANISLYAKSMYELDELNKEILICINYDIVDDKASKYLNKLRKRKSILEIRIKDRLNSFLANAYKNSQTQETFITVKNGKYVVPIKNANKKNIDGDIVGRSTKGSTMYVEPSAVKVLREELEFVNFEEEKEVHRILVQLTNYVEQAEKELRLDREIMVYYDFIFAKAKYSKSINANPVSITKEHKIKLIDAIHPLIFENPVPLYFEIGYKFKAFIITGPNTGGKTVAIKTVGLLALMVMSGLHIPCREDSVIGIFGKVFVDIGDGQSIAQSLSTFSSHIKNIAGILSMADQNTMVILDELGAGTDPTEGMGLAISIMETLEQNGVTLIATTHYSEIKAFAKEKDNFENGCMEFDTNSLKPLYKLSIGKPGESNALIIASKLGVPEHIITRAYEITYNEKETYKNTEQCINGNKYDKLQSENEELITNRDSKVFTKNVEVIKNEIPKKEVKSPIVDGKSLKVGDLVYIGFMKQRGVVCENINSKGELGIMIMQKKYKINIKRVKKYIDSEKMYPDNYDMDIVFESKENRKKNKKLSKRHCEDIIIEIE